MNDRVPGLGGIVLCGGKSSRMGMSKAWLDVGGEALLTRVVRRVAEAAWPVVVVAAADQELPPLVEGVRVVRDARSERGPLEGLSAGLAHLEGVADAALVSSTDAALLEPAFARRLAELRGEFEAVVPRDGGHLHPLLAVYALNVRRLIEDLLAADKLRTSRVAELAKTRFVERAELLLGPELRAADPDLDSLRNMNTPDDYADVLAKIERSRKT